MKLSENRVFLIATILAIIIVQCGHDTKKKPLVLLCASGMTDVASEICDSFRVQNNIKINMNFASSGTLARQIEQGNFANIYISASKQWADYVDSLGNVAERKLLFKNRLVLVAPNSSSIDRISLKKETNLADFLTHRIAIGDPLHVPAGKYAKEALENLNWYAHIKDKLLPTKDVRSALMMVELGECDLGIVYYSDALKSDKVKIVAVFPDELHQNINFHALLFKNSPKEAKDLYQYLNDSSVLDICLRSGLEKI